MTSLEQDLWLGQMLGKPAYRICGRGSDMKAGDLPQTESFIEARVDVTDSESLARLQDLGFVVIDCNMTLELEANEAFLDEHPRARSSRIRFATVEDENGVRTLARESFEYNRFRRDPRISNEIANTIKEEWAANFFVGARGEWMVVAEDGGEIVGFLQLMRAGQDILLIDLVAVASQAQRRGVARLMISFALRNCIKQPGGMRVGTQLSNQGSLRLYESMGFRLHSVVYLLHLHQEAE